MVQDITSEVFVYGGETYGDADGFQILNGGTLQVGSANDEHSGSGTALSAAIKDGGEMNIHHEGTASTTIVDNGGKMVISAGLFMDGEIVSRSTVAVEDVVVSNGGILSAVTSSGYIEINGLAVVSGGTLAVMAQELNGGSINISGLTAQSGTFIDVYNASNTMLYLVGSETLIASGTLHISGALQENFAIADGVLTGANLTDSGANIGVTGIEAVAPVVAGGRLMVTSGTLTDATLTDGILFAATDTVASGISINGGTFSVTNRAYVSQVNIATGSTLLRNGGVIDNLTMADGIMRVSAGGTVLDAVMSGVGSAVVFQKGVISGLTVDADTANSGMRKIYVSNGGLLVNATLGYATGTGSTSRTNLYISSGATVKNLIVSAYANNFTFISAGAMLDGATLYGGTTLNLNSGANIVLYGGNYYNRGTAAITDNLTVSGGNCAISGGVVNNLTIVGGSASGFTGAVINNLAVSGGLIRVRSIISGAVVLDGLLSLSSGGSIIDGVAEGGEFKVSGGVLGGNTTVRTSLNLVGDAFAAPGAVITFDIADRDAMLTTAGINRGDRLAADFSYNVAAAANQTAGVYKLMETTPDTIDNFTLDIAGKLDTVLAKGNIYTDFFNAKDYLLALDENTLLSLTVTDSTNTLPDAEIGTLVNVNNNDLGARWSGTFGTETAVDTATAGNVWLIAENSTAITLYGASADISGSLNLQVKASEFSAVMGGAENNTVTIGGVNLTVADESNVTIVFGAGRGNVAGDVNLELANIEAANNIYGGAVLLSTATGAIDITGDVNTTVTSANLQGDVVGGGRVNGGATVTTETISGSINLTLVGGTMLNSKSIYGGGYAVGNGAAETELAVSGGVNIVWDGTEVTGTVKSGRGIFGGALAANDATALVENGVNISVVSGTATNIFGGGWAQNGGESQVNGDVNITIDGGSVVNVFGGGAHAVGENGSTKIAGDIDITIAGGSVDKVYARGQSIDDAVTGTATVTFTGTADFATAVSGAGYNGANADEGISILSFSKYSGSFSGTVANFARVDFAGNSTAVFSGADVDNAAWSFDLTDNDGSAAMLNWSEADFTGDMVDLMLDNTNSIASWSLATVDSAAAFDGTTFSLYIDGVKYTDLAMGETVGGSVFAGYKLTYDESENTLKFAKMAAL